MSCSATTFERESSNGPGRRRHEDELIHLREELVEAERPVVERGREPEPEVDERLLARRSPSYMPAELRHGLMRLVDEAHEVVGEVVDERERVRADRTPFERARVVLDPAAEPELLHHLEVVLGALSDPVRLEHPPLVLELRDLLLELGAQLVDRALDARRRGDVLRRRPDDEVVEMRVDLAGERVEVRDLLDLVAEERDAVGRLDVRRLDLDDVALHPEAPAPEDRVVADVLALDELREHGVAVVGPPHVEDEDALPPLLRRAEAVDARDRGDDHDVAARQQRRRRRQPQPRDVVVLGRVLLDVQVACGMYASGWK
jgi:hypothetical protein